MSKYEFINSALENENNGIKEKKLQMTNTLQSCYRTSTIPVFKSL